MRLINQCGVFSVLSSLRNMSRKSVTDARMRNKANKSIKRQLEIQIVLAYPTQESLLLAVCQLFPFLGFYSSPLWLLFFSTVLFGYNNVLKS